MNACPVLQSVDQNWADESTTYWFDVDGETFGVIESSEEDDQYVDCDGNPDNVPDEVLEVLKEAVTDELRESY